MHASSNVLRVRAKCQCFASLIKQLHASDDGQGSFALLHVHYDTDIDIDDATNQSARLDPRKIELESGA